MVAGTEERSRGEQPGDLAASAAEGMLGPNPFVGLRPCDVLAAAQKIGTQALRQPALVVEQEAKMIRDLIAALGGGMQSAPPPGDKRFGDAAWRDNPFYRMTQQGYFAWRDALSGFVDRCALDPKSKGLTPEEEWPRHIAHEFKGLKLIKAVNERFKAPRDCQELALLVGEYHTHGHRALELKPSTLLELLQSFDVYRRPQRFEEFIAACEMDARGRKGLEERSYPQADYLRGAATAARSVAVQPLLEKGFKGPELGEAIKRERLKALKAYKETASA